MNFDILNQPHPHPLYFFEEGKNDGSADQTAVVACSKCRRRLRPPAFSCSDSGCNFHLHQSCINLPSEIRSLFHPQHPLFSTINNDVCNACWQMPSGQVYSCRQCGFQIDIKCAIADPKATGLRRTPAGEFRHFNHPHPLALQQNGATKQQEFACVVCGLLIKSGDSDSSSSHYFCSQCDAQFHKKCAELPRQMQDSYYHEHPLILLPNFGNTKSICNSCKNDCREFIYSCPPCNFNLHVACLQSFNHKHSFTKLRTQTEFVCRACGQKGDEFSWFCTTCHLPVHKKCAELPSTLRTYGHRRHDLRLTYFRQAANIVRNNIDCKICSEEIKTVYAGYGCYECNYFVHLNCASSESKAVDAFDSDDDDDDEKFEISSFEIKHFIHPHSLKFLPLEEIGDDRVCDGCMKRLLSISSNTYGCKQCDFIVHKECLELPKKKRNFLHKHKLTLISIPNFVFQCEACRQHFHGFAYRCKTCFATFDTRCASIKIPFQHPSHEHPLSLDRTNEQHNCEGCGEGVKNRVAFRCVHCNFHLDAKCATLPLTVRYKFDAHALELGFVEEEEEEYYCDVCECEREVRMWFYGCRKCNFGAHLECVVGEFPYVKSKMHEAHKHPLNLAMKGKNKEGCEACGECCADDLAFECGVCKFNVHAVGQCYHLGTVQGKLASTNRCFYYRGIGLHQHPIQNGWTLGKLGPYGGKGGSPWEEKFFSTIRGFAVYHKNWVYSFQIQHEINGTLVWSRKHGGDGGSRSEVFFDYPNEYLVSIHGSYSDLRNWRIAATVIRSLTLVTNKRSYEPLGKEHGTKFSFPAGVKFRGLHGRSGSYLDAIGPYKILKE